MYVYRPAGLQKTVPRGELRACFVLVLCFAKAVAKLTSFQADVKLYVNKDLLPPKNKQMAELKKDADKVLDRMAISHFEAELYVAFLQTVGKPKLRKTAVDAAHSWIIEHAEDTDPSGAHPLMWAECQRVMKGEGETSDWRQFFVAGIVFVIVSDVSHKPPEHPRARTLAHWRFGASTFPHHSRIGALAHRR